MKESEMLKNLRDVHPQKYSIAEDMKISFALSAKFHSSHHL